MGEFSRSGQENRVSGCEQKAAFETVSFGQMPEIKPPSLESNPRLIFGESGINWREMGSKNVAGRLKAPSFLL